MRILFFFHNFFLRMGASDFVVAMSSESDNSVSGACVCVCVCGSQGISARNETKRREMKEEAKRKKSPMSKVGVSENCSGKFSVKTEKKSVSAGNRTRDLPWSSTNSISSYFLN